MTGISQRDRQDRQAASATRAVPQGSFDHAAVHSATPNAPSLEALRQAEGQSRWRESLQDWTWAAIFAIVIGLAGRYLNDLLEGFSPEGTSWL
jgi:hypothetical protein|tara:strand:+ start:4759 stop:5037 length:279 start_codon:yes stop_codon:yes gene_type:complete